ncbi:phospho-sugar mutase [bacterium SCSIO 12741]|nr:phospho-sugar mutase [bacterium SCSIO 12741]
MQKEDILNRAQKWLAPEFDENTRTEVQQLIDQDPSGLAEAFHQDLEFGTGGLRGIMGVGTNRINQYTIGMATQGLANYLLEVFGGRDSIKVAIAHDSRNRSEEFARTAAEIMAANGIHAYLYDSLRPTPQLSFTIREYECVSGIVITASHNPKEYNGYKVYFDDGGQLVPPHDKKVIEEVRKIDSPEQVKTDFDDSKIEYLGEEADQRYHNQIIKRAINQEDSDLKIVYTPIHGTGIKGVPEILDQLGYQHVFVPAEQAVPDGNFPTVQSPNPEEPAALALALELAEKQGADLVLGTDPDSDRVGIAVRNDKGEFILLNGNQTAALLTEYMISLYKGLEEEQLPLYIAKTIVTSELLRSIADAHEVNCYDTLTGFKWIAEMIRQKEGKEFFVFGGEESYGYLMGDFVRDKDAVVSVVMICEMAAQARKKGSSLYQELIRIYQDYDFYKERLLSITRKGISGAEEIRQMMSNFRDNTPSDLGGLKVAEVRDYQSSTARKVDSGEENSIDLPASNVMQFVLEDGSLVTARPSGTEPKIKFYISVKGSLSKNDNFEEVNGKLEEKLDSILSDLKSR